MKIILDESVPRALIKLLALEGCVVDRFPDRWRGLKNGALLSVLEKDGYGCLLTSDRNMQHQQGLADRSIAIVVLPGQKLGELSGRVVEIAEAVIRARAGQVTVIPR